MQIAERKSNFVFNLLEKWSAVADSFQFYDMEKYMMIRWLNGSDNKSLLYCRETNSLIILVYLNILSNSSNGTAFPYLVPSYKSEGDQYNSWRVDRLHELRLPLKLTLQVRKSLSAFKGTETR